MWPITNLHSWPYVTNLLGLDIYPLLFGSRHSIQRKEENKIHCTPPIKHRSMFLSLSSSLCLRRYLQSIACTMRYEAHPCVRHSAQYESYMSCNRQMSKTLTHTRLGQTKWSVVVADTLVHSSLGFRPLLLVQPNNLELIVKWPCKQISWIGANRIVPDAFAVHRIHHRFIALCVLLWQLRLVWTHSQRHSEENSLVISCVSVTLAQQVVSKIRLGSSISILAIKRYKITFHVRCHLRIRLSNLACDRSNT